MQLDDEGDEDGSATRGQRTRAKLGLATIAVLIEHGFSQTTVDRVAKRARVSKGALQHHYPTKEDLLAAAVEQLLSRSLRRPVLSVGAMEETECVARSIRAVWSELINTDDYRALMEVMLAARTEPALRARLAPVIANWSEALDSRLQSTFAARSGRDEDVRTIWTMNRALLRGLMLHDDFGVDPADRNAIVEQWITIVAPLLRLRDRSLQASRATRIVPAAVPRPSMISAAPRRTA